MADERSEIERRLIYEAEHDYDLGDDACKMLVEAADRIRALERALAGQLALCPGCGGSGYTPPPGDMESYPVVRLPCFRCSEARAALGGEGGQGDGLDARTG